MAQDGDTITYTYDGDTDGSGILIPEEEDVSSVNEMTIDYLDGAGGSDSYDGTIGGSGGRVEGTVVDLSNVDTIYLWVAASSDNVSTNVKGRYVGDQPTIGFGSDDVAGGAGGGSAEISLVNTDITDSDTEPFIAAAGAGGGGGSADMEGGDAARGHSGSPPPQGGLGGGISTPGEDGEGAVAGHGTNATIKDMGTTTTGGGSDSNTTAEIQVSYAQVQTPPNAPTNLSATLK